LAKDSSGREVKNWAFAAGDNPTVVMTLTDSVTGSAIDLTSATAKLTVANVTFSGSTRNVSELFELNGVVQTPATSGIVHFQPTRTQANQPVGAYEYDIQVTFPDLTRRTVARGNWEYTEDITDTGEN